MIGDGRAVDDLIEEIELIYRGEYPRFLRVAVAYLGDTERGRDAVHEAFVRAIRSIDTYRWEGSVSRSSVPYWRTALSVSVDDGSPTSRPRTFLAS